MEVGTRREAGSLASLAALAGGGRPSDGRQRTWTPRSSAPMTRADDRRRGWLCGLDSPPSRRCDAERPCPQPCPELGDSDPTQPHLAERKAAQTATKALQTAPFKTDRRWQPQGWKVGFLRRSEYEASRCAVAGCGSWWRWPRSSARRRVLRCRRGAMAPAMAPCRRCSAAGWSRPRGRRRRWRSRRPGPA